MDENEQVLMRIIDLLVVGGFRIGETLTLPCDCWVDETPPGIATATPTESLQRRCGIRYWPEKGGDPIVKWLPDCAVPLARRAVDDLTRLGCKAREAATVLEQDRDRVTLPGALDPDQLLTLSELAGILCLPRLSSLRRFLKQSLDVKPAKRIRLRKAGHTSPLYRARDIERALLRRRGELDVVRTPDGQVQALSESLCVVFMNQFDYRQPTFPFLAELVSLEQIAQALGSKTRKHRSVFDRHGFTAPDGKPLRVRTHAFRHWINTLADRGGLSDAELARWMGRRDTRQNEAYKHGTVEQRAAWAQQMLIAGDLVGPVANAYQAIPDPARKQDFLQSFLGIAHFTPYGVCTHDFALTPCRYHLNCLAGCAEYLRTRGNPAERENLIQLRTFTDQELRKAKAALAEEDLSASNWIDFNRRVLAGIDAALAVDARGSSPGTANTTVVFPAGKTLGRAIR